MVILMELQHTCDTIILHFIHFQENGPAHGRSHSEAAVFSQLVCAIQVGIRTGQ